MVSRNEKWCLRRSKGYWQVKLDCKAQRCLVRIARRIRRSAKPPSPSKTKSRVPGSGVETIGGTGGGKGLEGVFGVPGPGNIGGKSGGKGPPGGTAPEGGGRSRAGF